MKSRKLFAILTLVAFMMTLLPMAAFGAISGVAVTPADNKAGVVNNYAVAFTTGTALTSGQKVTITFPEGYNLSSAASASFDTGVGAGVVDGNKIEYTVAAGGLAAGSYSATITDVKNPTVAGSYSVSVATSVEAAVAASVTIAPDNISRFATIIEADRTSQVADGSAVVKFTVYGYDAYNNVIKNPIVTVLSSRGTTDTIVAGDDTSAAAALHDIYGMKALTTTANKGYVKFKVSSNTPGTAVIYIAAANNASGTSLFDYFADQTETKAISANYVGKKEITFTAPSTDKVILGGNAVPSQGSLKAGAAGTSANPWETSGVGGDVNGNGVDTFELAFKVVASNNAPVAGATVDFSASNTAVTLNKTTATTDAAGIVKVKASASKPGTYKVKATVGDKDLEQHVKFLANEVYSIKLISEQNQKVAKDSEFSFKIQLKDQAGNQIDGVAAANGSAIKTNNGNLQIHAVTRPSDVALDEKITEQASNDYKAVKTAEGYLEVKIAGSKLDKEGDYSLKIFLDNGASATLNFSVHKQGTVTRLAVEYDQSVVALNTAVGSPTVKRYDANGVYKKVDLANNEITFTASDVRKVTGFNKNLGSFVTTNDKDYAGTLVITAVDTSKKLTATATIEIAKQVNGFTLTAPVGATEVGKDAVVNVQWVDVDGKAVSVADATAVEYEFYVISKPSGAIISTSQPGSRLTDLNEKGTAALKIQSNVAGDVTVQVIATVTGGGAAGTYTKDVKVSFGAPKVVVGAKNVTMFIGATGYVQDSAAKVMDVAPFIKDGRTFVAVRPLAEAFGAEIGWNEATQTVTLTRSDMTLTIVIGSNAITKVAGGVTSTVTADVPAFIKDGRTVLPFRAVGEAFGATVSYDAATQAVSFAQ